MAPSDNGHENQANENGKNPVGAALVVGAGIAGMQAALDLAEAGIKVYLMDHSPAIGGTMAQLDKTFPTNDCAMCIMSPKLVEVGRHLNIELVNCAEVEGISGEPGDFNVTLRQHPRFVDLKKCTGCGDCAAACPVSLADDFNGGLSRRKAIYKRYPQAIPNAYAIDKLGVALCRDACPIHQRAQGYLALVQSRFLTFSFCKPTVVLAIVAPTRQAGIQEEKQADQGDDTHRHRPGQGIPLAGARDARKVECNLHDF